MLVRIFILSAILWVFNANAETPQTFTLDGRLYSDPAGTTPLADADVELVFQILDSSQTCILYEETRSNFNSTANHGYFAFQIGSVVGDAKRSSNDSGFTMRQVFSNLPTIGLNGKLISNGLPCAHSPSAGAERFLRVSVTPSTIGATRVLSPNMAIDSVPYAIIAENAETSERLGTLSPSDVLQKNTNAGAQLSQANAENIFSATNYPKLTDLLAGTSALYNRPASNGTSVLPALASPASPSAGQIWYNSGAIYYHDGTSTRTINTGSSTSVSADDGTESAPSISFNGDVDTGWFLPAADTLAASTGGDEKVRITSAGSLGVGTSSPVAKLEVKGANSSPTANNDIGVFGIGMANSLQIQMGGLLASPYTAWMQVKSNSNNGSTFPLSLNPVGGNVGIGTTAPAAKLDVRTTAASTDGVVVSNSSGNIVISLGTASGNNGLLDINSSTGSNGIRLNTANVSYFNGSLGVGTSTADARLHAKGSTADSTALSFLATNSSNANLFAVRNDGNVGIGTTAPWSKLVINATDVNNQVSIMNTEATASRAVGLAITSYEGTGFASTPGIVFNQGRGTSTAQTATQSGDILGKIEFNGNRGGTVVMPARIRGIATQNQAFNANGGALVFDTTTNGTNSSTITERMRIDNTGFVGIGTTSPQTRLHISSASDLPLRIDASSGYAPGFDLFTGSTRLGTFGVVRSAGQFVTGSANNDFVFRADQAGNIIFAKGDATTQNMKITNAGNVGIGTTSPAAKLSVNGAAINESSISNSTTTIDFSKSNLQYTSDNCGAFILHHLKDGGTYTFAVQGTTSTTCSFTAYSDAGITSLTVKNPPDLTSTISGKHTLFTFLVMGGFVYVAWMPGF